MRTVQRRIFPPLVKDCGYLNMTIGEYVRPLAPNFNSKRQHLPLQNGTCHLEPIQQGNNLIRPAFDFNRSEMGVHNSKLPSPHNLSLSCNLPFPDILSNSIIFQTAKLTRNLLHNLQRADVEAPLRLPCLELRIQASPQMI